MILDLIRLILSHVAMGRPPTRVGQRVYLNPRKAESHPTMPYKGSIHECEGTIEQYYDNDGTVRWDNGESGDYYCDSLTVCDFPFKPNPFQFYPNFNETNPNLTFKRWKIKVFGSRDLKDEYIFAEKPMSPKKFDKMLAAKYGYR